MMRLLLPLPFLAVLAAYLIYAPLSDPLGTPQSTLEGVQSALRAGDLEMLASLGMRRQVDASIRAAGEARYAELSGIFEKAQALGEDNYRAFIQRIMALGRQSYSRLSREERTLIRASIGEDRFMMSEGIKQLPREERARIKDVDAFLEGREADLIALQTGMEELSHEEWEKVKEYDFGELRDRRPTFVRTEGKRVLRDFLLGSYSQVELLVEGRSSIRNPRQPLAEPSALEFEIVLHGRSGEEFVGQTTLTLVRRSSQWHVEDSFPPLF